MGFKEKGCGVQLHHLCQQMVAVKQWRVPTKGEAEADDAKQLRLHGPQA